MTASYPPLPLPDHITESYLQSHDLNYHLLSAGQPKDPLVLCLHGFPELAYSWRKILPAIAKEGYHVVAYDQRGYGRTTGWDTGDFSSVNLSTFSFTILVRDAVVLANALGHKEVACVLGHDFGSVVASLCVLLRPEFFKSVVLMSHPFQGFPNLPFDIVSKPPPPSQKSNVLQALASLPEPRKHYKWYYSTAPAAAEMDNPREDLPTFLRGYFHLKSADWEGNDPRPLQGGAATEFAKLPYYYVMPLKSNMRETVAQSMASLDPAEVAKQGARWFSDEDLGVYVEDFGRNGFQGGLNWYRVAADPKNMRDVELFAGRKIDVPSMFISGKKDWGTYQDPGGVEKMGDACTNFKGVKLIDGAGHWVQQEQPEKLVELVAQFLRDVKKDAVLH